MSSISKKITSTPPPPTQPNDVPSTPQPLVSVDPRVADVFSWKPYGTEATSKIQPPVNGGPSVANALNPGKTGALAPATTGVPETRPPPLDPVAGLEVRLEELLNDPSLEKFQDFMVRFNLARGTTAKWTLTEEQAEELDGKFFNSLNRAETCLHKIGRGIFEGQRLEVARYVASQLELAKVPDETQRKVDKDIKSIAYVEADKDFTGGFGVLYASKAVLRELAKGAPDALRFAMTHELGHSVVAALGDRNNLQEAVFLSDELLSNAVTKAGVNGDPLQYCHEVRADAFAALVMGRSQNPVLSSRISTALDGNGEDASNSDDAEARNAALHPDGESRSRILALLLPETYKDHSHT